MNKQVEVTSLGKLYIAGEYSVVVGGGSIIFPVFKNVSVRLKEDKDYYVYSHKYHDCYTKLDFESEDKSTIYIKQVINFFNKYIKELGIEEKKYKIEIHSSLDNDDNKKYGFGSSAAIIISLLKALFVFYNIPFDKLMLFKAGVIVQANISKYTSFGDLACISYGSKVYYKKFDPKIFVLFSRLSISELLKIEWEGLVIEELNLNYKFLIVHTNEIASSYNLVRNVLNYIDKPEFEKFRKNSDELVIEIKNNSNDMMTIIEKLNLNLRFLNTFSNSNFYTKGMENVEEVIKKYNGVYKFSGAGGGDCVICFFEDLGSLNKAKIELQEKGYDLLVYKGSEIDES